MKSCQPAWILGAEGVKTDETRLQDTGFKVFGGLMANIRTGGGTKVQAYQGSFGSLFCLAAPIFE
jgi:hypothetical protein